MAATDKTILVIEDDQAIRSVIEMILKTDCYQVKTAANGLEALQQIHQEGLPDLILLDMRMPQMNGWEFAAKFYELYGHSIPIVVLTAAADSKKRASDINADGWLGKPFSLLDLRATVKKYLNLKNRSAA